MLYQGIAQRGLTGNMLLASLDAGEYQRLFHLLRVIDLGAHQTLYRPGDELQHVYFPVGCVVTGVAVMDDGATVETAMIGPEGVVGVSAMTDGGRARYWTRVLLPGEALRMEAWDFRELFKESPACQRVLLCYYSTLITQVSRRAVCNSRHRLSERLCTWLLMVHDRAGADDFPVTQEAVARQLGVRRAGVNECVGWLEGLKIIDHARGHIRILRRDALEAAACVCYPAFEAEARWFDGAPVEKMGVAR
jgi:CRP-like cAMP-binding protein